MKNITLLFLTFFFHNSTYCQLKKIKKKNQINLTFDIRDFYKEPTRIPYLNIKTVNEKENSRYGKYSYEKSLSDIVNNHDSIFSITISKSRFSNREVFIKINDISAATSYFEPFNQSFTNIYDGQEVLVKMPFDEEKYKNRKTKILLSSKDFIMINESFIGETTNYNKSYKT
tara:strand:+ start:61 stop:576 length:516 start_codon:yes stop_codon:yes gene_type:complete